MQSPVITHSNDLVDLYHNAENVAISNCTFIISYGNQYNVFLNDSDPHSDFGRFSFPDDLFPQRSLTVSFTNCTFVDCKFSANIYRSPVTADTAAAKISVDPSAQNFVISNFTFNHVRGTQYHIFPFHPSRITISKQCGRVCSPMQRVPSLSMAAPFNLTLAQATKPI